MPTETEAIKFTDAAPFDALYTSYSPIVYKLLISLTGDREKSGEMLILVFRDAGQEMASFSKSNAGSLARLLCFMRHHLSAAGYPTESLSTRNSLVGLMGSQTTETKSKSTFRETGKLGLVLTLMPG